MMASNQKRKTKENRDDGESNVNLKKYIKSQDINLLDHSNKKSEVS